MNLRSDNTTERQTSALSEILTECLIAPANPESSEARGLVHSMYQELTLLYGGTPEGRFPLLDCRQPRSVFVIARVAGKAVGCGAILQLEDDVGEIKRMFVDPAWRGRGLARAILDELEAYAHSFGYRKLRLETGSRQPEAIRLYEGAGYRRIAPYGCHLDDPLRVCFEKGLGN